MKPTKKGNHEWMYALGAKIARERGDREWSQDALAANAAIDRSQLANIELGKAEPKIGTLRAIAGALNMTVSEILKDIPGFDPLG